MGFPSIRTRRLRRNKLIRDLVTETKIDVQDFILPLFVCHGKNVRNPISSMPGHFQLSEDELRRECDTISSAGLQSILLFGIPKEKDQDGRCACREDGIIQNAVRTLKKSHPNLLIITDICNCEYTTHGHCGPLVNGDVHNDQTIEILAEQALSHARAGADIVAPSDMMDGRVGRIRQTLDNNGFQDIAVMSYAAKYASAFYGPFREAAESAPTFGDRKSYQMDPANSREALREVELDIEEGADIIMVKPALSYLDIINQVKTTFRVPIAAYNVSGEFSMVKAAAQQGWVDEKRIVLEILTSIKRAGADIIITYHALEAAHYLAKEQ